MLKEELITYLKSNRHRLNLTSIAQEAGIPESTLRASVLGSRPLPAEHVDKVYSVIKQLMGSTDD